MPGERAESGPVARARGVRFADGSSADVDLFATPVAAPVERVFAAMVFVRDAGGDFAVVRSVRRDAWGAPGGWREPGESVLEGALREVTEETGLVLEARTVAAVGYERFSGRRDGRDPLDLWVPGRDLLQAFAARLDRVRPALAASLDDTDERRWVTRAEFEELCSGEFWWPLAAVLFPGG